MRERHDALVNNPAELEKILRAGAQKARTLARPFMAQLRDAVGLRDLAAAAGGAAKTKAARSALPSFKQYREADGRHYFKLVDGGGRLLALSTGFESPQQAGRTIAQLRKSGPAGLEAALELAEGVDAAEVAAALEQLAQAQ
jgi:tryptophanyl-tRNA synthetase